jgi:tRNA (guanine9-N1)-methyltransferase
MHKIVEKVSGGELSQHHNAAIMESEERPAKMRKLGHTSEDNADAVMDAAPSNDDAEAQNATPAEEQPPLTAGTGEEIIGTGILADQEQDAAPKISKNQLKKQRRLEKWEAGRDDRKLKRKEKIKEKKERRREAFAESRANGTKEPVYATRAPRRTEGLGTQVPITVLFDCDWEDLMFDHELKSLGLQITRCYSDNRKAPYRFHIGVSSFGGKLKERFDGILAKQYENWKGFHFCEEDFVAASEMSKEWMKGEKGGTIEGALQQGGLASVPKEDGTSEADEEGEVVYLSAESDVTLERLKPNSTYIIGGLVDKNRHKGVCYKRAVERGMKTAKLPIGEFLQMKSRQVLVTNHVMEIMLRWVEFNDWGKAFMSVLPKRKGVSLKNEAGNEDEDDEEEEEEEEEEQATPEEAENEAGPSEANVQSVKSED